MSVINPNANVAVDDRLRRDASSSCPSCGETDTVPFLSVPQVPAHSTVLLDSVEAATSYPCGDISLSICKCCGFITNDRFDFALQSYSPQHEESQHFSSHFTAFAHKLAKRWIDNYAIREKTVLEIGCGKGDFLELLCKLGNNRGIGIDPGCDPLRLSEEAGARIRFIQDYYSKRYSDIDADIICCRHTLEHIQNTAEFVETIRYAIGARPETLLLFELPDMTRILRECAFWDIYYEHCSYFTAGSLARLFRQLNFDVVDLRREYDDQYLTLAAYPSDRPTAPRFDLEDDLEQTLEYVTHFRSAYPEKIREWQSRLGELVQNGRKVVAWGSGSKYVSFCTALGITDELAYVVDINPYKRGKFSPGTGHRILGPEDLRDDPPDVVLVMNSVYRDEIQDDLDRIGVSAELLTL